VVEGQREPVGWNRIAKNWKRYIGSFG
jgi:hypothetical protein